MCITIVAANLNISQAVNAAETIQDNKIKSGDKEPIKYTGNCKDNSTWIENPQDNSINSTAYFVKNDNRRFATTDTPQTDGEKYYKIICNSIDRVNYKDSNGNLLKINNKFVQSIITREIQDIKEEVVDGKLEKKQTNKSITDTYFINTGNDYVAKFPTNPNQGFYFKTSKFYDGTVFEVVKVSIGGKELKSNTPVVKDNTLTYPEVLPGVDLKYILNTNGIAKYFEIKNAEAIKQNDLTSFSFDLADNTKLEKKDEKKEKLQAILEGKGITKESTPTLTKAKEGVELVAETKQVTETKTTPVLLPPVISIPINSSSSSNVPLINSSSTSVSSKQPETKSNSSTSSSSVQSSTPTPTIPTIPQAVTPVIAPIKTETTTTTQNKTETEILAIKETIKSDIVKELDSKIVKLEEVKKEEESKGDKRDNSLIEITNKTIESSKSISNEVKSNSINVADEKQILASIKGSENSTSGTEKLILPNSNQNLVIGLPNVFDQDKNNIETLSSTVSNAKDKLTITINKDYLNSSTRKFPIFVDPSITVSTPNKDVFVSEKYASQNWGNRHFMVVGANANFTIANGTVITAKSRALLGFQHDLPGGTTVVNAKLQINQFDGNGINLDIFNSQDFDENNTNWDNHHDKNTTQKVGSIGSDGGWNWGNRTSQIEGDITGLIRMNNQNGSNQTRISLREDCEGCEGQRGVVFCARELASAGHPCSYEDRRPKLEILYTRTPGPAVPINFQNSNDIGQCDLSKPTGQNGKCETVSYKRLDFSGVNSGDGNSENSKSHITDI
jgi:hypothetical protein